MFFNFFQLRNRLSVYYESICPDSRRFILNQVVPLHEKFDQFIDLELVPFGNANVTYPNHDNKPVFQCQHGPDECYGNRAQACVIELIRNQKLSLNYVNCMFEDEEWKQPRITAEKVM